jgi:gamma-glutamyltranspeptidase / glutathione hydrolase
MRGAVAAGHPLTAEVGAQILREGGNAVDACIAAGTASWVAESPLTGPGGGAFMLVHRARDRSDRLIDAFVTAPGLSETRSRKTEMEVVDIDFEGGESSQVFRIGAASCAVPGAVAGLAAAHRAYGSLPWRQLIEPAIDLARDGIEMTRPQAYLHAILDLILRHTAEGRKVYGIGGERLGPGDVLRQRDLAETLETLAVGGPSALYAGSLGRRLTSFMREQGGRIAPRDLADYRVIWRRPIRVPYRGHEFVSNPPPSSGGVLIGYGLRLLDAIKANGGPGSETALEVLVEVMREQVRAREGRFATDLYRGGLARRLYAPGAVRQAIRRIKAHEPALVEAAPPGGTTHISVVDARGNAASLSASLGSGSGMIVPGTGIHMNNMLGEYDLLPSGRGARPGRRLTSMMAPSIVLRSGRPRLVVGSAGSVRLRGAIMQIVVNAVEHGLPIDEAIGNPRLHVDGEHVHCEGGADPAALDALEARGYDLVRWRRRNLFFGGAAGVELLPGGTLAAAGDPRRGGHGLVVEA